MATGDKWVVETSYVVVRDGPTIDYNRLGEILKGTVLVELDSMEINGQLWIKHSSGWSMVTDNDGKEYMYADISTDPNVITITENTPFETDFYEGSDHDNGSGYQPDIDILNESFTNSYISDSEFVNINHVAGVFGLPYQFLPTADIRLDGSSTKDNSIGFEYAERIVEKIPLLFLAPGKASFMTSYSTDNKKSTLNWFINKTGVNSSETNQKLDDLLSSTGKYYTFEYDTVRYYEFVNPMCRIAARYLNLQDVTLPTEDGIKPLDAMNWESYTRSGVSTIGDIGTYTSIPFYVDADTSISESFSNSTTQSMIASSVNSISDMAKELHFLLGAGSSALGLDQVMEDVDIKKNLQNIDDMVNSLMGRGNIFSKLSSHLTTVASGGKLMFPEIWSDSTFSRSYSCKFKFIAPDPSDLSIYLNVLVPLFHLIGLVAPQSVKNNPNGYTNPFLVRAMYKGFFNVDMGIITDMSITKGAECQWSPSGMPTSMEVSISIKDLYPVMSITPSSLADFSYDTMSNTALMDYIANLCGINIYKPEISRLIEMMIVNKFSNKISDFGKNIWNNITQKVQNSIMNIYDRVR